MNAEAIRGELLILQTEIDHLQPQLRRSERKSEKTISQLTREWNITKRLNTLHQRRKEFTEMLPAVSAPVHPVAGPSQSGFIDMSVQPRQPSTLVQPPTTSVVVASGSDLLANLLKDEPMNTDSDGDDATPPPTSDIDLFHPFLLEDDKNRMLVDSTNFDVDFYHHNTAKAVDEYVYFPTSQLSPANTFI